MLPKIASQVSGTSGRRERHARTHLLLAAEGANFFQGLQHANFVVEGHH